MKSAYLKEGKKRQKARQKTLVRHLASTETTNQRELSKASSTSYRTTLRDIDELESLGLIEFCGEEKTGPRKPQKNVVANLSRILVLYDTSGQSYSQAS